MADGAPAASGDVVAEHGGTEDRTPLTELLSEEAGAAGTWGLKVFYNDIKEYTYTWKGKEQTGRKLVIVLLSLDADQYCLGFARYSAKSGESSESFHGRFATGTVWRFT